MKLFILDAYEEESAIIAGGGNEIDDNGYFVNDRVSARTHLKSGEVDANEVTHMDACQQSDYWFQCRPNSFY